MLSSFFVQLGFKNHLRRHRAQKLLLFFPKRVIDGFKKFRNFIQALNPYTRFCDKVQLKTDKC